MERRRLIINFKNTPEEIKLYEELKSKSSISGYIKDVLKGNLKNTSNDKNFINENDLDSDISDILDL